MAGMMIKYALTNNFITTDTYLSSFTKRPYEHISFIIDRLVVQVG